MKTILISGGTGLIGSQLQKILRNKGHSVVVLTRNPEAHQNQEGLYFAKWDISKQYIDLVAIKNIDGIINLAGENIAGKPWSEDRKKALYHSRISGTNLLYNTIRNNNIELDFFISASGISYYGTMTTQKIFVESDAKGNDFLANLSVDWEQSALQFETIKIRTVIFRTGVVLSNDGGALPKMSKPIQFFIGSAIGSGKQYMPWIHIQDMCRMYVFAMESQIEGIFNAVVDAKYQLTNRAFGQAVAKTLNRPFFFPNVPGFVLKLIFKEMASIILEGSRVANQKIRSTGFDFDFPMLEDALKHLRKKKKQPSL